MVALPLEIYHVCEMRFPDDEQMLSRIERFLISRCMSATRFGLEALNDGALVFQLRRRQRSLTLRSAGKVIAFMNEVDRRARPCTEEELSSVPARVTLPPTGSAAAHD